MTDRFARIAGWCVGRPVAVVAGVAMVALIGAVAALRLEPDAGTDQLVDSDSAAYRATQEFRQKFGDDAVVVLVKGNLEQLVLTSDLGTLLSLEGCLSGNVARRRGVHRRAGAGAVRGDRRLEARPGGARRRDVPEPVRDQRLEAAAVADPGRGASRRGPPGWRPPPAPAARVSARPTSERRLEGRRAGGAGRVRAAGADAGDQVRTDGSPPAGRPDVRELGGLRQRPRRTAEAALLALLAERRLGADPGPVCAPT